MSRRRIRLIVGIVILLVLLLGLAAAYWNYSTTRSTGIGLDLDQRNLLAVPQYLYSFSGPEADKLARPLGVLATANRVYVTDSRRRVLDVFTPGGNRVGSWGKGKLITPLYAAQNPKTSDIWVSDRRVRTIFIFDQSGKVKGEFKPNLPKSQLPKFDTKGFVWAPVAFDFAPDGTLYVTEILNGHRLLIFGPDGKFRKSVGTAGLVEDSKQGEELFQFPNSVKVLGNEVWVADSNNRRLQVFDRQGEFKRLVVTQGLPRGFDFLPKLKRNEPTRFVVIDTLSHDGTIWEAKKGEKILSFGERGVLEGQFSYPNDTSVNPKRLIFVADSANGRIQVWGWPDATNPVPLPRTPLGWLACLSPLFLLPLLLLFRKRRYFATEDFVLALYEMGEIDRMPHPRVRWEVLEEDYEKLKDLSQNGVDLGELLQPTEFSESDARALQTRYELTWRDAIVMSLAQRARLFGTQDPELRRVARVLEVDTVTAQEFVDKTEAPKNRQTPTDVSGE